MRSFFLTVIIWHSAAMWLFATDVAESSENGLAAVPEPATSLLGILGVLLILLRRGRN